MSDVTMWCSFCNAEPAVGNVKRVTKQQGEEDEVLVLPACDECGRLVIQDVSRVEVPREQWVDSQPGLW